MKESKVEKELCDRVKALGGEVRKLGWINRNNAPDRLVLYKHPPQFVELKRPGKKLRSTQAREHARMRKLGASVWAISTIEQVDEFIKYLDEL